MHDHIYYSKHDSVKKVWPANLALFISTHDVQTVILSVVSPFFKTMPLPTKSLSFTVTLRNILLFESAFIDKQS